MSNSWRNWCRLCGSDNSAFTIEYFPEIDKIIKECLKLTVSNEKICAECLNFLNDLSNFSLKTKIIDKMFQELATNTKITEKSKPKKINDIRLRFGLKEIIDDEDYDVIEELQLQDIQVLNPEDTEERIDEEQFLINSTDNECENQSICVSLGQITDTKQSSSHLEVVEIQIPKFVGISNMTNDDTQISELAIGGLNENEEWIREYEDEEFMDIEDDMETLDQEEKLSTDQFQEVENLIADESHQVEKNDDEKYFEFICHICHEEFPKMVMLTSHCKIKHDCLPQVVCMCGKSLGTWKRLVMHKRAHLAEKVGFECPECKMFYMKKTSLDAHIVSKHGPNQKVFECETCGKSFKESKILKGHMRTHLPEELKKKIACETCGKTFVNRHCLEKHINSFHTRAFIVTCEICDRDFTSKGNLKSHMLTHQTEQIPCDSCDKVFKSKSALRMHKKTHEGIFYACPICDAKFAIKSILNNHMLVHSSEKKYKCPYENCPNEYKRPTTLKCHLSVHTGERPYECQFCNRTFVNGSNCRKHKLKDHPEELAEYEKLNGRGKTSILN